MTRLRPIRFSIRSLLLLAALIAIFLGWRLRNPESEVIAAVKKAGGRAVFGCNLQFIYEGTRPSSTLVFTDSKPVPPMTLYQFAFGNSSERRVHVVEAPIEKITPELAAKISTLRDLKMLIATIPANPSTNDLSRVTELKAVFGNRFCHDGRILMHP